MLDVIIRRTLQLILLGGGGVFVVPETSRILLASTFQNCSLMMGLSDIGGRVLDIYRQSKKITLVISSNVPLYPFGIAADR